MKLKTLLRPEKIQIQKMSAKDLKQLKNSICITLRQSAILFSILIFIFTSVFTICSILGYIHARNTLNILQNDIAREREKTGHGFKDKTRRMSHNEIMLMHSQPNLINNEHLLKTLMHFGWLLMVLSGLLIYGTTTKSPKFMMPWIIISALIYLFVVVGEILVYCHYIDGFNFSTNIVSAITVLMSIIYFGMWYTIVLYHTSVKYRTTNHDSSPKLKIVSSYGDYVHTVNTGCLAGLKKPIV